MNDEDIIDDLLDRWEDARNAGQSITVEELCDEYPKLIPAIQEKIDALVRLGDQLHESVLFESRMSSSDQTIKDTRVLSSEDTVPLTSELHHARWMNEGGQAVIWTALEKPLSRNVIVKTVKKGPGVTESEFEQFQNDLRREAELTAKLEHRGVAPVYGLGRLNTGEPFFVMRRFDRNTLDEDIKDFHAAKSKMSPDERAIRLRDLLLRFLSVCETIEYAHNRGVLHLDIKPRNIISGKYGETIVLDWGLAIRVQRDHIAKRREGESVYLNRTNESDSFSGSKGGTLHYMSPEQASGVAIAELTRSSDIYSLGATLVTILTGEHATEGHTRAIVIDSIKRGTIRSPKQIDPSVHPALDAICRKAMQLSPDARYSQAEELANEVKAWLADTPVSVYTDNFGERLRRWGRRNRTAFRSAVTLASAFFVIVLASAVALGWMYAEEKEAKKVATEARKASLKSWASSAADSIANSIDIRWRILERLGRDPELIRSIEKINTSPSDQQAIKDLVGWTNLQKNIVDEEIAIDTLTVLDLSGHRTARSGTNLDGENPDQTFKHRSYFWGGLQDLDSNAADKVVPLRFPYFSSVYVSTVEKKVRYGFAGPIWSEENSGGPIGVVLLSNNVGDVIDITTELNDRQMLLVVDTRRAVIMGQELQGLVVIHPKLRAGLIGSVDEVKKLPTVDPATYDQLVKFVDENAKLDTTMFRKSVTPVVMLKDFRDPLNSESSAKWIAAAAPVRVRSRPGSIKDPNQPQERPFGITGLVAIVCEQVE